MRLTWISTVLASVSLAAAVAVYVKVDRLERNLGSGRAPTWEGRGERRAELPAAPLPEPERGSFVAEPRGGEAARQARPKRSEREDAGEMTVEERLTRLEEVQRGFEAGSSAVWPHGGKVFARSVDDLARRLSLTPTQRTRIEDTVARGRERIEEILKIPDETGKSPSERRAEARKKLEEAMKGGPGTGGILAFAGDLMSYRENRIPGRGETYGEAVDRIRKETREEISGALDTTQQELLKDTNVDGLLGEGGQMSFALSIGDSGDGRQAGILVETHAEEEVELGEPAEPAGPEGR